MPSVCQRQAPYNHARHPHLRNNIQIQKTLGSKSKEEGEVITYTWYLRDPRSGIKQYESQENEVT